MSKLSWEQAQKLHKGMSYGAYQGAGRGFGGAGMAGAGMAGSGMAGAGGMGGGYAGGGYAGAQQGAGGCASACGPVCGVGPGEDCVACGVGCGGTGGGNGALSYVGCGQGEYIQETTYKYVGCGGDFDTVRPRRDLSCIITGCCLLSLLLLIPLLCWLLGCLTTSLPYDCLEGSTWEEE